LALRHRCALAIIERASARSRPSQRKVGVAFEAEFDVDKVTQMIHVGLRRSVLAGRRSTTAAVAIAASSPRLADEALARAVRSRWLATRSGTGRFLEDRLNTRQCSLGHGADA